jgi:type IV secretion system protein TrbD
MSELQQGLHRNRIHRSLSRPNLLFGADRELVLVVGLASVILVFVVLTIYAALFGMLLWGASTGCLRMMAKSDPFMRAVYLRYLAYRPHYRSTTSPWRKF